MENDRSILTRRAVLFGVPFLYLVLGLFHPTSNPEVGDETGLFIGLHIAQLFLIGGLAYALWLLVDGIDSRAARVARALILPFAIAYTTLDAILGLAWGIVAQKANELAVADQAAAGRLVDELLKDDPFGYALYWGAGLLWLATALAVVIALRKSAPLSALVLMGWAPPSSPSAIRSRWARSGWGSSSPASPGWSCDPVGRRAKSVAQSP
jgi:hypothetical protein